MDIQQIVQRQHDYFATGATLDVKGRLAALESRSTDLYTLLWPQVPPCGTDYTESIVKV